MVGFYLDLSQRCQSEPVLLRRYCLMQASRLQSLKECGLVLKDQISKSADQVQLEKVGQQPLWLFTASGFLCFWVWMQRRRTMASSQTTASMNAIGPSLCVHYGSCALCIIRWMAGISMHWLLTPFLHDFTPSKVFTQRRSDASHYKRAESFNDARPAMCLLSLLFISDNSDQTILQVWQLPLNTK